MRRRAVGTVLVGRCTLLREGLARILGAGDFRIVASASHLDEIILGTLPRHQPILLIIDASGDPEVAVGQIRLFKEQNSDGRVAVLADRYQLNQMASAFRAGANAYFVNVTNCDAFIKSLELVMIGETIVPPAILSCIRTAEEHVESTMLAQGSSENVGGSPEVKDGETSHLSLRERCILGHLINGESNKTIARKIDIAEATVKVHVKAILRKIRVQNRTQAAIWAINNGRFIWSIDSGCSVPEKASAGANLGSPVAAGARDVQSNGPTLSPAVVQQLEEPGQATSSGINLAVGSGIHRRNN